MKKIRLRHSNNVDLTQTFSASIRGGGRGFDDAMALESHSNDIYPTVKTVNFCVIVEVSDETD